MRPSSRDAQTILATAVRVRAKVQMNPLYSFIPSGGFTAVSWAVPQQSTPCGRL